jgi:hypothetical protein
MKIILKIQRYNPDVDEAPYYQELRWKPTPTNGCWMP